MKNPNSPTFATDNFQLASYLLAESCELITVDKLNPRRAFFIFEESVRRIELTQKFMTYQAVVEPHRFFSAQKDLKQILYQD